MPQQERVKYEKSIAVLKVFYYFYNDNIYVLKQYENPGTKPERAYDYTQYIVGIPIYIPVETCEKCYYNEHPYGMNDSVFTFFFSRNSRIT